MNYVELNKQEDAENVLRQTKVKSLHSYRFTLNTSDEVQALVRKLRASVRKVKLQNRSVKWKVSIRKTQTGERMFNVNVTWDLDKPFRVYHPIVMEGEDLGHFPLLIDFARGKDVIKMAVEDAVSRFTKQGELKENLAINVSINLYGPYELRTWGPKDMSNLDADVIETAEVLMQDGMEVINAIYSASLLLERSLDVTDNPSMWFFIKKSA